MSLWPYRSLYEATSAIWTDIMEDVVYAVGAEGAFESADSGFGAVGRKCFVTVFAGGAKLEHEVVFLRARSCPAPRVATRGKWRFDSSRVLRESTWGAR